MTVPAIVNQATKQSVNVLFCFETKKCEIKHYDMIVNSLVFFHINGFHVSIMPAHQVFSGTADQNQQSGLLAVCALVVVYCDHLLFSTNDFFLSFPHGFGA